MECLKLIVIILCLLYFFPISTKNDEEYLVSSDSRMVMIDHDLPVKNCNENKTGKGYDYRGCQNKTKNGYLCQRWDSDRPHQRNGKVKYNLRKKRYGAGKHNYCRNLDDSKDIWCYTTNPNKRWEYCNTRKCGDETLRGHKHHAYRGCQNKTRSGYSCQKWNSQNPHRHGNTPNKKAKYGVGNHNYCRNPDGAGTIWCYTKNPNKRWEYCNPKTRYKPKQLLITKTRERAGCSSSTEYKAGTMSLDRCAITCANGVKGAKSNSISYGRHNRQCWCAPGICKEVKNNRYNRYHIKQA